MKNLKTLMIGLVAGAMVIGTSSTAFAGVFDFSFSSSKSSSETTTVKDSLDNEYEVTHKIETVDGETHESYENVPIEVVNETEADIVEMNIVNSDADNWGDNWFDYLEEGYVLESEHFVCTLTMNYFMENPMVDIRFETADGSEIPFNEIDLRKLEDPEHIVLTLYVDEETGDYMLNY